MISISVDVENGANQTIKNAAYQRIQGRLPDGSDDPTEEIWLDVTNYIDYMILNHYGGNDDWPNRNWYANRRLGAESEGFRFFAWDSEISLALSSRTDVNENYVGVLTGAAEAYDNLRATEEFRSAFADRIHKHLFNGGALYVNPNNLTYDPQNPPDNVPASRFDELSQTVYEAMVAESVRWGDQHVTIPRTRDIDWQQELDYMLGDYFRDRHDIVLNQWAAAGLYPQTTAPEFLFDGSRQHGGEIEAVDLLGIVNTRPAVEGVIYYTTDGSDPRLIGGAVNTVTVQTFTNEVSLSGSMILFFCSPVSPRQDPQLRCGEIRSGRGPTTLDPWSVRSVRPAYVLRTRTIETIVLHWKRPPIEGAWVVNGSNDDCYHASLVTPSTKSKCVSMLAIGKSYCLAAAAIQTSFSGIGRPLRFNSCRTAA